MLIFAAILAIFVYGLIAAMLGTILPDLSDRFHLTPAQNGTIAFMQALGLMVASLGVGPLLDNQGDKIGLVLGLAFIAIALFALPRSPGFRTIVLLLFLLGIGGGIVVTGANALVSGVTPEHRATALNLVNLFFGLGGLTTPFISANLFKRNWVRLCYTVASLTVVTLVIQARCQNARPYRRRRIRSLPGRSGSGPPAALPAREPSSSSTSPAKWAFGTGSRATSSPRAFPNRRRSIFFRSDSRSDCSSAALQSRPSSFRYLRLRSPWPRPSPWP